MKIAIVIPVWIQDRPELIDQTARAAAHLCTTHDARLWIACTRLHQATPDELRARVQRECPLPVEVLHEPGVERSVAGAWNWGCRAGLAWGADYLLVTANDVEMEPPCIDALAAYGDAHPDASIWSGLDNRHPAADPAGVYECCDFACLMLRPSTLERFGWFDEHFRPAYHEDNDYYTRVVIGGGQPRMETAARFLHHVSLTIRTEAEAAHHVQHWWETNRTRYAAKWGPMPPPNTPAEVKAMCHQHPWGDVSLPVSFWDRA